MFAMVSMPTWDFPHEPPLKPERVLDTNALSVEQVVEKILKLLIAIEEAMELLFILSKIEKRLSGS